MMHHTVAMWTHMVLAVISVEISVSESTIKKRNNTEQAPCNCADLEARVATLMENQANMAASLSTLMENQANMALMENQAQVATMAASLATLIENQKSAGEEYTKFKSEFYDFKRQERLALGFMLDTTNRLSEMNGEMRLDVNWLYILMCNLTQNVTNNKKLAASETKKLSTRLTNVDTKLSTRLENNKELAASATTKLSTRLTNVDTKLSTRLEQVASTGVSERRTLQQGITLAVNSLKRRVTTVEAKANARVGFSVQRSLPWRQQASKNYVIVKHKTVHYMESTIGEQNVYNQNTGYFIAPIGGLYCFSVSMISQAGKPATAHIKSYNRHGYFAVATTAPTPGVMKSASATGVMALNKGGWVWVESRQDRRNQFTGFLIAPY